MYPKKTANSCIFLCRFFLSSFPPRRKQQQKTGDSSRDPTLSPTLEVTGHQPTFAQKFTDFTIARKPARLSPKWRHIWKEIHFKNHQFWYQCWISRVCIILPVVPGQAGGGSFQKEKNYIAQKEFAYRMCARRPTSAMPKSFLCCERAFCRSMVVMFCALKWSVLMSWCLLRGQVMWWSGHVIWCDVMACFVSCHVMQCDVMVMSCTTPVLLCTTKYYSNTTLFYKVLLQYYSVLRSTTPILLQYYSVLQILLCTTKYYSSTTLYYKVLLQY